MSEKNTSIPNTIIAALVIKTLDKLSLNPEEIPDFKINDHIRVLIKKKTAGMKSIIKVTFYPDCMMDVWILKIPRLTDVLNENACKGCYKSRTYFKNTLKDHGKLFMYICNEKQLSTKELCDDILMVIKQIKEAEIPDHTVNFFEMCSSSFLGNEIVKRYSDHTGVCINGVPGFSNEDLPGDLYKISQRDKDSVKVNEYTNTLVKFNTYGVFGIMYSKHFTFDPMWDDEVIANHIAFVRDKAEDFSDNSYVISTNANIIVAKDDEKDGKVRGITVAFIFDSDTEQDIIKKILESYMVAIKHVPDDIKQEKYKISGVQFPGEDGITTENMQYIMAMNSGYYFDFMRIDGENSSAMFCIDSDTYMRLEEKNLIKEFESFIKNILDDVNNETINGVYEFMEIKLKLEYA